MIKNKLQIGIIGSAGPEEYALKKPSKRIYELAYELGYLVAKENAVTITGGEGGIMEAACKGAKKAGGTTAGILGGNKRGRANSYVDVEVVSGSLNYSEESIIISSSDGIVAVGGGSGTLQEIALAYRNKKAIVALTGIKGYSSALAGKYLDDRKLIKIYKAKKPKQAIKLLLKLIG